MREFDKDLTEYITKGYAPDFSLMRSQPHLDECKELMVTKTGLRARPDIHDLSSVTLGDFSSKNPEVFNLNQYPICTNDDGTWRIDNEIPQKFSTLANVDVCLDFSGFIVLSDGSSVEEYAVDGAGFTDITPTVPSYPVAATFGAYRNAQAFMGLGSVVGWSSIGQFDFTIGESGDAGTANFPFPGDVLRVLELAQYMVAYGDSGASLYEPLQEPRGAWKIRDIGGLETVGLRDPESLALVDDKHYFIGNDDNLWVFESTPGLKRIGFDYLLRDEVFKLVPLPMHQAVYLVGETVSYLYAGGLSKVQHVSRSLMQYFDKDKKVAGFPDVSTGYDQFEVRTQAIDFGHRQPKHIQGIEVGLENAYPIECQIHWRTNNTEAYRTTPWIRVSPGGYVHLPCSGIDFKVAFRGQLSPTFSIHSLKAKIKYEGKSNIRGRYVN